MENFNYWCEEINSEIDKGKKYVLVGGASSSGKSYSCDVLKEYLEVKGKKCLIVSLDNFYKGVSKTVVQKAFLTNKYNNFIEKQQEIIDIVKRNTIKYPFPQKFQDLDCEKIKNQLSGFMNNNTANEFLSDIKNEYKQFNFDEPFAIDFEKVVECIFNRYITKPKYSFIYNEGEQCDIKYDSNDFDVIIIEGIYALREEIIQNIDTQKVIKTAVNCDMLTMLSRKFFRDVKSKRSSLTFEQTFVSYLNQVLPSYFEYIKPTFKFADFVFDSNISTYEQNSKMQPTEMKMKYTEFDKEILLKYFEYKGCQKQFDYYISDKNFKQDKITLRIRFCGDCPQKMILNYDTNIKKGFEVYNLDGLRNFGKQEILDMFLKNNFKIDKIIEKNRKIYEKSGIKLKKDEIFGLGTFIEFDKKHFAIVRNLFKNKTEKDFSTKTYPQMFLNVKQEKSKSKIL